MNDYLLSVVLGIIEGLTEFLPVSSTAHLRIAEALLNIDLKNGFWKMYTIVIQLGAIIALTVFFWRRILKLILTFPRGENGDRTILTHPLSLVLIAFIITALPSFLLVKLIGKNLESLYVMSVALLVGGVIMWIVDAISTRPTIQRMEQTGLIAAIWIGAVQTLSAVFPGTSRSMCTIAAGQIAGMSRETALEFSFFLSIPTMFVATSYDLLKTIRPGDTTMVIAPLTMNSHLWSVLAIGFAVASVVALGVVAWFLRWVRNHGFAPFAIYRIFFGVLLLILLYRGAIGH